jgi:hypothetical protein
MGDATADRLRQLAHALFFLDQRARSFVAIRPAKRLDRDLLAKALAVRDRMLRVLAYHAHDEPLMQAEIASIKTGTGYMDIASDLARVAVHYTTHRERLERERVQYDPADENLARGIANEILKALAIPEDRTILDLRARAYTMTARVYTRLKEAGDFIFANEAAELEHFPPLRKAAVPKIGRPKGSKKRADPAPAPAPAPASDAPSVPTADPA